MSALEPYSSTESGCNWKCDSLQEPLFDEMQMSNHGSFGVRRLVAPFVLAPGPKRRQVAALHVGLLICPSLARIRGGNRVALLIAPTETTEVSSAPW